MKILMILFIIISMIMTLLTLILNIVSKKSIADREKSSPFECGFDPKNSARLPFSLQFFLIAVIFLIFDVEIALLLPIIISMKSSNLINYSYLFLFFILILLIGLFHEWNQGALNWSN
uniref:NADH-ubiquinone oxidoreductase chain 3 n=1 Tax=Cerambycidae sp. 9 KM-2017 TaxID=2219294 RepID=A0A346RJB9_9CUCU|nr:NADH dehydrogenase subunit 3 [Cerambycidae sp. 9 KM-2017]